MGSIDKLTNFTLQKTGVSTAASTGHFCLWYDFIAVKGKFGVAEVTQ